MLVRIVKMTFDPNEVENFQEIFQNKKKLIRNQPGCNFLELYRDKNQQNIFFTYSYWENEAALDAYRHSKLFKEVWADTKKLFSDKPEAWSVEKMVSLE